MMSFGLEVMLLPVLAMLGAVLSRMIGQSSVLWMIVMGVIVGPTGFGLISYTESIKLLAELGAIFMLFAIGLECNYREIYNLKNSFVAFLEL